MNRFWEGKRVLVTGHTGFKGSWLSLWLTDLGATVYGLALEPETNPALFTQLDLASSVDHHVGDIRQASLVARRIASVRPDVVFHLAAQPLVRESYADPIGTWGTNVMGTVHVLESLRALDATCAVVIVTTDKVYENREWLYPYREVDRLGGHDPYSSSKSAAELAAASWRSSFFANSSGIRLATARAGNVIGGGDWATDRIVPDLVRALSEGRVVSVRNPAAVRPWQHVLEPLSGYLLLAQQLFESDSQALQGAFNFGPNGDGVRTVADLISECLHWWPGEWVAHDGAHSPHEAGLLTLTSDKARSLLGWQPRWSFHESCERTMAWYLQSQSLIADRSLCLDQIDQYSSA